MRLSAGDPYNDSRMEKQQKQVVKKHKKKRSRRSKSSITLTRNSKDQINELVQGLGLVPVVKKKNAKAPPPPKVVSSKEPSYDELVSKFILSIETELQYVRNGHAVIHNVLSTTLLTKLRNDIVQYVDKKSLDAWKQKVEVASNSVIAADDCLTVEDCIEKLQSLGIPSDSLPFLQYFNIWRSIPSVRTLVTSPLLGQIASELMDVETVRLYQDSVFHKRVQDGETPWHSDARMAPFDTSNMVTLWIPLQYIPEKEKGGTGLLFVDKSHSDIALPYWNTFDCEEYSRLDTRYGGERMINHHMPLNMGDLTAHAGWTLHCSEGNFKYGNCDQQDRYALAVTFVDAKAEIREEVKDVKNLDKTNGDNSKASLSDNEDRWSYKSWVLDVNPRAYFEHDFVPIVWPTQH